MVASFELPNSNPDKLQAAGCPVPMEKLKVAQRGRWLDRGLLSRVHALRKGPIWRFMK